MMKINLTSLVIIAVYLVSCGPDFPEAVSEEYKSLSNKLDYNIDVNPVLSDKCFLCHGPDKGKISAGLQFHSPEFSYAELPESPGKFAIVPKSSNKSELVARILSEDSKTIMPTPESHLSLTASLWGNGFLPTEHQGVQFRSGKDPVLFLSDPENYDGHDRRHMLDYLNNLQSDAYGDPEIQARMSQYEMAFKMQTSVPEVTDLSDEPDYMFDLYGKDSRDSGTYAANCLMERKLLEKGVKFVQLYHQGWDQHGYCLGGVKENSKKIDQANAALIKDLKQHGMFEDTLIVWGGEFGRTVYSQGQLTKTNYGRDHHTKAFTMWMAVAGVKPGFSYGETDDFSYNVVKDPVHVHDFHTTLMHLFGVDHEKLTFKHQGRCYRLTDVHGNVVNDLLA